MKFSRLLINHKNALPKLINSRLLMALTLVFSLIGFSLSFIPETNISARIARQTSESKVGSSYANPLSKNQDPFYKKQIQAGIVEFKKCLQSDQEKTLICANAEAKQLATKHGARFALDVIEPVTQTNDLLLRASHDIAHTIGDYAVKYFNADQISPPSDGHFSSEELRLISTIGKTLVDCDGWGAFGCYHGVIEVGLSRLPVEKRTEVVRKACLENPLIQSAQYYINQCLHWFGHGMSIFTNQSLIQTLNICDGLSKNNNFGSDEVQLCLSGVFHAGSVPGTTDVDYLSNISRVYNKDDVYFPCLEIPDKFRGHCFSHIPGRTGSNDVGVVFRNCENIPEPDPSKKLNYIHRCYDSGANLLLVNAKFSAAHVIQDCKNYSADPYRKYCYAGAVRYWILRDPLLNNRGPFEICQGTELASKQTCYKALGAANNENYFSPSILAQFCSNVEEGYFDDCLTKEIKD